MLEIPAFVRRRSARNSFQPESSPYTAGSAETNPSRTTSVTKRLTKTRRTPEALPAVPLPERTSRHSLVEFTRKSLDRKSIVFQPFPGLASTPSVETSPQVSSIASEPFDFPFTTNEPDQDTMSADLLKTVAKKTSLKNILCDKPTSSDDDESASIDIDAAISLLKELKKRASPEDLVALHRALLPVKDGGRSEEPDETLRSPYSRRSSFVTPGVATRTKSPVKPPKERKSLLPLDMPLLKKKQRPSSDQFISSTPKVPTPLLRQSSAAQLQPHTGIPSLARSYSPADLDIAHIGGLGLGTLRVTNGAVSPEPSIRSLIARGGETSDPRADSSTPKPSDFLPEIIPTTSRGKIIPGLEAYTDSSDDDSIRGHTTSSSANPVLLESSDSPADSFDVFRRPALNASVGSFVSRLSTIQDDESVFDGRLEKQNLALQTLSGHNDARSPPRSSGSDSSFANNYLAYTAGLTLRPGAFATKDSGYSSELQPSARPSSSDDEVGDLVRSAHLRTPVRPMHMPLETIASVSTLAPSTLRSSRTSTSTDDKTATNLPRSPELRTPVQPSENSVNQTRVSPLQRNPPSASGSVVSVLSDSAEIDSKPSEKGQKVRNKLHKAPPTPRNNSDFGPQPPMSPSSPGPLPVVPDELSINFSRRITRAPGSYHPEHTFAAHSRVSQESLCSPEIAREITIQPVTPNLKSRPDNATKTPVSEPSSTEPVVQKKKSRFRLRGRTRSKSMTRPDAQLPLERDSLTVADTVVQYADATHNKENLVQPTDVSKHNSPSMPRQHGRHQDHSSPGPARRDFAERRNESVLGQILSPSDPRSSRKPGHRRAESMPRTPMPTGKRQAAGVDSNVRPTDMPRRQRSKSVAPAIGRSNKGIPDEWKELPPTTPNMKQAARVQSPSRNDPLGPPEGRKERRSAFAQVFLRSPSSERAGRAGSKSPKVPDVNNPAYIAARMASPPPDRLRGQTPRSIPWETDHTRAPRSAAKQSNTDSPRPSVPATHNRNVSDPGRAERMYQAYRRTDAVSMNRLVSPTRDDRLKVLQSEEQKRASWASGSSRRTPSPSSVLDRFSGGLDYGWERGVGFSESAGTRSRDSDRAHRKSAMTSEKYGVDLSDVPVFIERAV